MFFYPNSPEILETWISISSFKYFRVVRIEKYIRSFLGEVDNLFQKPLADIFSLLSGE